MKKVIIRISFFIFLALALFSGIEQPTEAQTAVTGEPVITSQPDGLRIAWQTPDVTLTETAAGIQAAIPGFEQVQEPGLPQLPQRSVLIALPPDATPNLTITSSSEEQMALPGSLATAPQPEGFLRNSEGEIIGGAFVPADETLPFDRPPLELEEIGAARGMRLARLTFYPVRPSGGQLIITREIEAELSFGAADTAAIQTSSARADANPFRQALAGLTANPAQLQAAARPAAAFSALSATANETAVIEVSDTGITAVTYNDLAAAGFPVGGANPAQLKLARGGTEVPLEWLGDGDAQFEPGESFRFYAQPWFNRWSNKDFYTLTAVGGSARISSQAAPAGNLAAGALRQTLLLDENRYYTSGWVGRDGDRWIWDELANPGHESEQYDFTLESAAGGATAELKLWLMGANQNSANPDHKVTAVVNGAWQTDIVWDGKTAKTVSFTLPAGVLQTGGNSLQLTLPNTLDKVWLDAIQVTYTRGGSAAAGQTLAAGENPSRRYSVTLASSGGAAVYDVTTPDAPIRLTNITVNGAAVSWGDATAGTHQYLAMSNANLLTPARVRMATPLRTTAVSGADYVIIAPTAFMPALTPLINLRQSQGMTVVMEDVQAIYDAYGGGQPTPEAIRDFLADVYGRWSPAPTYVLLVGDGTNDPKQYKPDTRPTWIPPYLADVDPWLGEVAADNRFVTVDGADLLPDMLIGRLPVNSLAEARTVVDKIVKYETEPFFGDWNSKGLFVTDEPDSAGDFIAHSDALISKFISPPWSASRAYLTDKTEKDKVYTAVMSQWNAGQGMVVFNGHSSIHQWSGERLFHLDDVAGLNNNGRLPVVLQMTCFTGAFQEPFWDTLDEVLLRQEGGGAVAVWGATGLGVATGHGELADGFMQTIIKDSTPQLGQAALAGKVLLQANQPAYPDLLDTFTLLGDPATRYDYDFWPGYATFLPTVQR
ncbi:MAG TPA: hypothetical protein ENK32_10795 [Anaerolineae bacterium]|nr:hypothetical protein [Anaerolineae bacterium]